MRDIELLKRIRVFLVQGWQTPSFVNSWVNFGGGYNDAGYFKDPFGIVHLRGLIKLGTVGQNAFVLPAGYRPAARELFNVQSNGALGRVDVLADGSVFISSGNNAWVSLDGLTFKANA